MKAFAVGLVASAVALLALAVPAAAHVTVSSPGATRGGSDQVITFRVPVEKDIPTVGLKVQFPTDTPIASVLIEPIAGWTHMQRTAKLAKPIKTDDGEITSAVSEIDWSAAAGHGLQPGEYGEFRVIAGQLPDADQIAFGVVQVYADGSVVEWNQVAAPGSNVEPDHPKPVLTLAAAPDKPAAAAKPSGGRDTGAIVLSVIALVVAAGALGLAAVTRVRARR